MSDWSNNLQSLRRVYPIDIYTIGAANRTLALSSGFKHHIQEFNLICAGVIVRLHLDTAIQFSAAWLVSKPHDFVLAFGNSAYTGHFDHLVPV